MLVAFFFPIATLMTVLSANLTHGLEDWNQRYGPWVLAACIAAGLILGMIITGIISQPVSRPARKNRSKVSRK
jgi:hypothetical protein